MGLSHEKKEEERKRKRKHPKNIMTVVYTNHATIL